MTKTRLVTIDVLHLSHVMQYDWIEGRFRSCDYLRLWPQ